MVWRCLICLPILFQVGCGTSTTTDPIVFGYLNTDPSKEESQGIELALKSKSIQDNLPLGKQLRILSAPLEKTAQEVKGQATQFSELNRLPLLIGPNRASLTQLSLDSGAEEKQVHVVILSTAGCCAESLPNPALFNLGIAPRDQGEALAQFAQEQKWTNIALLKDPSVIPANKAASNFIQKMGRSFVREFEPSHVPDWPNLRGEFRRMGPGAVVVAGTAKNLKDWQSNLSGSAKCPWIFCGEEAEIPALRNDGQAIFAASSFIVDSEVPDSQKFAKDYQEAYQTPPTASAALGFEAVQVAVEAIRRAKSTEPQKIREELTKPDATFNVLSGPLTFSKDQTAKRRVYIVEIGGDGPIKKAVYPK
jgi:ABC-type branched-subunit amino acid transport system substrate-binding protein